MPGKLIRLALATFCCFGFANGANADVIFMNDQEPVHGIVISEIGGTIEFWKYQTNNELKKISVPGSQVLRIERTIDVSALSRLTPKNAKGYRDIAELLSCYESDRYALRLANDLYVLAAFWGRGKVRTSAFKGLIGLVKTDEQGKRIRALAFQSDQNQDLSWLDEGRLKSDIAPNPGRATILKQQTLDLLQAIRKSDFKESNLLLASISKIENDGGGNTTEAEQAGLFGSTKTMLQQICESEQVSKSQLSQLFRLELELLTGDVEAVEWNETIFQEPPDFRIISFETVFQHDPQKCIFRDGEWQEQELIQE